MNGLKSIHYDDAKLAKRVISNISANIRPLAGYDEYQCFSDPYYISDDLYISPLAIRQALVRSYPDDIFVFNTRRFAEWSESRNKHGMKKNNGIKQRLDTLFSIDYDAEAEFESYADITQYDLKNLHIFDLDDDKKFEKLAMYLHSFGFNLDNITEVKANVTSSDRHIRKKSVSNKIRGLFGLPVR